MDSTGILLATLFSERLLELYLVSLGPSTVSDLLLLDKTTTKVFCGFGFGVLAPVVVEK